MNQGQIFIFGKRLGEEAEKISREDTKVAFNRPDNSPLMS